MKAKAALLAAAMLAAGAAHAGGYVLDKDTGPKVRDMTRLGPLVPGQSGALVTGEVAIEPGSGDELATLAKEAAAAEAQARCERTDSSPRECYRVHRLKATLDRAIMREQAAKAQAICGQAASFGCHQIQMLVGMRKLTTEDFGRIRGFKTGVAPEEKVVAFFAFVEERAKQLEEIGARAGCEATPEDRRAESGFCAGVEAAQAKRREAQARRRKELDEKATAAISSMIGEPQVAPPVIVAPTPAKVMKNIRVAEPQGRPADACPSGSQGWVALGTHDACTAGMPCVCRYDPNFTRDAAQPYCPGGKWERLGTKASCESGADCVCSGDLNVHR